MEQKSSERKRKSDEPLVMSSKQPVSFGGFEAKACLSSRPKSRDPRFDPMCGELNEAFFDSNYAFIDEQRESEIEEIKKELKKTKSFEKKSQLQSLLSQYQQELTEKTRSSRIRKRISAVKKKERSAVKQGKTPYFLKKNKVKELALQEKFQELKASGKLTKYLAKKRKSNASKDRRWMPYQE